MNNKPDIPRSDFNAYLTEAPADYVECLRVYTDAVAHCMHVSCDYGDCKIPTTRHFYASVLFTNLVTRATSLAFIAPYSLWARRDFEHWDYGSVANLARTILEIRLNFFYLCVQSCTDEEWDCRLNLYNLHDCMARVALMQALKSKPDVDGLLEQADELRIRLKTNTFFNQFSQKQRKEFLKGDKSRLESLENTARHAGITLPTFKLMWKLMSAHVHALPMSFYRMDDGKRGTGVQTEIEEHYTRLLLTFSMTMIVGAREEYVRLMESVGPLERRPRTTG